MSEFINDLSQLVGTNAIATKTATHSTNDKAGKDLDFNDYLMLMVAQFQNQTIDNTADTSEMLNQMVQMSVVQAITDISTLISESSTMTYAASLVGKQVTVGQYVGSELVEKQGTVTGTGTLKGQQVVFLDDKDCFLLTDIMAVGKLPDSKDNLIPDSLKAEDATQEEKTTSTADLPIL